MMMGSLSVSCSALFPTVLRSKDDGRMAVRLSSGVGWRLTETELAHVGLLGKALAGITALGRNGFGEGVECGWINCQ